ncbi:hypothetical protein VQL36_08800 [Chengkuizengella sp. SCS-71B]|uniref:hypothetical protein n=1 Tax=Chengkuizengella sp. SCS-71B TaxID=3115290 RepID=UPI0032C21539
MGLKKESFAVADTVSVLNPYNFGDPDVIRIPFDGTPVNVLTVDVCVKQPQGTQVSIDSMAQIVVVGQTEPGEGVTFEVRYEILRNGNIIATINDEMDYLPPSAPERYTNFPNFPVVDNSPIVGINTYDLRCTLLSQTGVSLNDLGAASRSLKATVFEC